MKHVWIIGKAAGDCSLVRGALSSADYHIRHIESLVDAALKGNGPQPDLIVIDLDTAESIDSESLGRLDDSRPLDGLPLLILSGKESHTIPARLAAHPLAAIVHGPYSEVMIADAVGHLMEQRLRMKADRRVGRA